MPARDDLMRQFGPKLLEAFALMVLGEINILRSEHGLAPRTKQQILTSLSNHVTTIEDYEWMED